MVRRLIEEGLQLHRAGRLEEAQALYEQALVALPHHPDALHLAGVVALQLGRLEQAATRIRQAIEQQPGNPAFHANLAQAYLALKQPAEARDAFGRAAALDPRQPQFAIGAANCLALLGSPAEAERQLRGVLQRHPRLTLGWYNLAQAVNQQGRLEEAGRLYRRAIDLDPAFADAHLGLGSVFHASGRFEEAERAYRQHLALQPGSVTGQRNLASVLMDRGAFGEAAAVCRDALEKSPGSADLHRIMGAALTHQGQLSTALAAFRAAVEIEPTNVRAQWGYGYMLVETGHAWTGLGRLESVLKRQPDAAEFRDSLSVIRLSLGDLQGGWEAYSSRAARRKAVDDLPQLRLVEELPDRLAGLKVCLLREQGLGDELFFLRFAAQLRARGAEVAYQAHARLASLLQRVPEIGQPIAGDEPLPAADALILIGDLPRALYRPATTPLGPRMPAVPENSSSLADAYPLCPRVFHPELPPSLSVPVLPGQMAHMRERLRALGPPPYRGVTWRAGTPPAEQRGSAWALHKSIDVASLATALRDAKGTWFALQRNPAPGEIEEFASRAGMPLHDFSALNEDLEGMLALLALLDDYVGVSNTNMHLRASAGRAARVLVPRPAEWRWMISGAESPWFPGFRLYRQGVDGNWRTALAALRADLLAA